MGHSSGPQLDTESPRELVTEVEGHLRALLRDVLCGYLDADLKAVADDILNESHGEPTGEIEAHDLRDRARTASATGPPLRARARADDIRARARVGRGAGLRAGLRGRARHRGDRRRGRAAEPVQHELDGVTQSADWGWDDPEDFSAPV